MTKPAPVLTGRQSAAIAVLALDEELAAQILAQLEEPDLKALAKAVDELDVVKDETLARVIEDLEKALTGPMSVSRAGGRAYMRKIATAALGDDRAQELFAAPAPPPVNTTELLRSARVSTLADLLVEEHPQIAAVVLTQLPARTTSKVLSLMPAAVAADLLARVAELDEIPDLAEASESLVRALAAAGGLATSDQRSEFDGLAFSAQILNELPQDEGDKLLEQVADRDDAAARRIREAMFTFEDLMRIDGREIAGLLRAIQADTLVVALQTAANDPRDHFLNALSKRAAATLRDDLSAMPPKRVSEVEAAQREIVELTMRLAAEGKLTLPPRGEGSER